MSKFESFPSVSQSEQDAGLPHDGEPYSDITNAWINQVFDKRAREEGIERPSNSDIADTSERERKTPRMFGSFDEIIEDANKSDDEMVRDFADRVDRCKNEIFGEDGELRDYCWSDATELYGECLFYLMHDDELLKKVYVEKYQKDIPAEASMQDLMMELVDKKWQENKEANPYWARRMREEEGEIWNLAECSDVIRQNGDVSKLYDYMNSMMHIMHVKDQKIRGGGIKSRNRLLELIYGYDFVNDLMGEVSFDGYKGLTGKSEIDESITAAIEGYLEPIKDDLALSIAPSWLYSHLDMGLDYDYSMPESINVNILATNKESRDMAMQILEGKREEIGKMTSLLNERS